MNCGLRIADCGFIADLMGIVPLRIYCGFDRIVPLRINRGITDLMRLCDQQRRLDQQSIRNRTIMSVSVNHQ